MKKFGAVYSVGTKVRALTLLGLLYTVALCRQPYNLAKSAVHVAFTCDSLQVLTLGPVMSSIAASSRSTQRIHFHIFTAPEAIGDAHSHLSCYSRGAAYTWELHEFHTEMLKVSVQVHAKTEWRLKSAFNYARYYFSEMLPTVEKILYLDNDIVVQGDVCDLYDRYLRPSTEFVIAAVERAILMGNLLNFSNPAVLESAVKASMHSFNAGVLLIHLENWRRNSITSIVEDWTYRNTISRLYNHGSQPPILLTFGSSFERLPADWNVDGLGYKKNLDFTILKKASVLHWSGTAKPWCPKTPYRTLWENYLREECGMSEKVQQACAL